MGNKARSRENDDADDESSERSSNDSSFNLRTLNINELKNRRGSKDENKQKEMLTGGDTLSINLLYVQAFLYTMNHFSIVPTIFEYAFELGYSPTMAGILLAMSPFATSLHAIIQNFWTRSSFKHPLMFGVFMIIVSNILFIYAYHQ